MKNLGKAIGVVALLLTAGCEVNVDDNLEAAIDNQAEAIGSDIENAAEDATNQIEEAGDAIDNRVDAIDNGFDVDINVNSRNDTAAVNTH